MNAGLQLSRFLIQNQTSTVSGLPAVQATPPQNGTNAPSNNFLTNSDLTARLQTRRGLQSGFQTFAGQPQQAKPKADILQNRYHLSLIHI